MTKTNTFPRIAALCAAMIAHCAFGFDHVVYLSTSGNDENGGTSWSDAYATPAVAVTAAEALGGTTLVLVAPGTYTVASTLVISGATAIRGSTGNPEDVVFHLKSGLARLLQLGNAGASVSGIALEGGYDRGSTAAAGAGRNLYVSAGTVSNCIVRGATLMNTRMSSSAASVVYLTGSGALMTHCVVSNNTVSGYGTPQNASGITTPGVYLAGGAQLRWSLVADTRDFGRRKKTTTTEAGGVHVENGKVVRCTIVDNVAPYVGGANAGASGSFTNCIVAGNRCAWQTYKYDNILPANAARFKSCVIAPESPNLLFRDYGAKDYRLMPGDTRELGCYEPDAEAAVGFAAPAPAIALPAETTLTASVSGLSASGLVYAWDFDGDGTADETTASPSVTHTFTAYGDVEVGLAVTDPATSRTLTCSRTIRFVPKTLHVAPNAPSPAFPYDSWANAASTVNAAADAAIDGCEVLVSNGTYGITSTISIELKSLRVTGLTGNPEDVVLHSPSNGKRIFYLNDAHLLIDGLTLDGGGGKGVEGSALDSADTGSLGIGRSLFMEHLGGTVSNCVIRGCALDGSIGQYGAASTVHVRGPDALVTHCAITNNTCTKDTTSKLSLECCTGISLLNGARMSNTLVADNSDTSSRGVQNCATGVYAPNANLLNCTIVNNVGLAVGGVRLDAGTAKNCVVAGNRTTSLAAANNNILSGSGSRFTTCASDDDAKISDTCTNASVSVLFAAWDAHDYRPAANGPLVDFGVTNGLAVGSADLDGNVRVQGKAIDVGCYELNEGEFSVTFNTASTSVMVPCAVTFNAACTGAGENDVIRYAWDFDGDGTTDLVTTDATATWTYTQAGNVSVSLSATDVTSGASGECVRGDYLYLVPKTMLVAASSPAPAFPYDTWQNAATNVQDAIDAAIDGVTIVFSNGNYTVSSTISVEKGVTLRGLADAPGDVVLANANAVRILRLNHAGSLVSGLVLTGSAGKDVGAFLCIDTVGGTVSNCVIRGVVSTGSVGAYANTAMMYVAGANSLMTHCVITGNVYRIDSGSSYSKEVVPTAWVAGGARLSTSLVADNTDTGARNITGYATVYASGGGSKVVNCSIVRNTEYEAGGLCLSSATAVNCVVAGNESLHFGDEYDNVWPGTAASCSTSVIGGDLGALFRSPARGDWTPKTGGALVNAGALLPGLVPATDLAGAARIFGKGLDIGCLENQAAKGTFLFVK